MFSQDLGVWKRLFVFLCFVLSVRFLGLAGLRERLVLCPVVSGPKEVSLEVCVATEPATV